MAQDPQVNLRHRAHLLEAEDKDQNSLWVRLIAYCKFFTLGFFWCGLIIVHMKVIKVCLIIDSINNSWTFTIDQALFYTFPDLWTCTFLHCILFFYFACSLVFELFHRLKWEYSTHGPERKKVIPSGLPHRILLALLSLEDILHFIPNCLCKLYKCSLFPSFSTILHLLSPHSTQFWPHSLLNILQTLPH